MESRPNVLFLMTDQHNASCAGYENHPQAITPHLDRLAASGVRFRNAYTANPICTPARVSLLSGQYCHNHGYFGLSGPRPMRLPHVLGHFRGHGYRSGLIGKGHLPIDPEDWLEGEVDFLGDQMVHGDGPRPYAQEYLDFLEREGFPNEFDSEYLLDQAGKGNFAVDARPSRLPFAMSAEGYSNRRAMGFMDEAVAADQPFCLQLSYQRPHQCYTPAQESWDLYEDDLDLPFGAFDEVPEGRPPHFVEQVRMTRALEGDYKPDDPVARMRRVWKGDLACLTHCDHAVGEMLDFLDERGLSENTIIVYVSDHGAYSGMFGVLEKAPGICSEQVCRIPMIWRVPGLAEGGRETDAFGHSVDVAPTLCSLAGLPGMLSADGEDLRACLEGETSAGAEIAVTEAPYSKSLRWKNWRYVHYLPEMFSSESFKNEDPRWKDRPSGELYDLDSDPREQRNLFWEPEAQDTLQECRRLLLDWLIRSNRVATSWPYPGFGRKKIPDYEQSGDGKQPPSAGPARLAREGEVFYL